jgi:hypothetical protein
MERQLVQKHLDMAERHVAQGERHIAQQRALIANMKRHGQDTFTATELLRTFERTQAAHVADRDRVRAELTALDHAR